MRVERVQPVLVFLAVLLFWAPAAHTTPDGPENPGAAETLADTLAAEPADSVAGSSSGGDSIEGESLVASEAAPAGDTAADGTDSLVADTAIGLLPGTSHPPERPDPLWRRFKAALVSSGFVGILRKFALRAGLLLLSIAVIVAAVLFFIQKGESRRFMTTTRLAIMDKEVQRACRYIEKHFDDPALSLDAICGDLVTGPAFLEALFEEELGMSVGDFIAQVRINRAKHMLNRDPDHPIADLAIETGFGDRDTFHATFVKIAGVNAEEFRDSIRTGAGHASRR